LPFEQCLAVKKFWIAFGLIASLSIGLAIYGAGALSNMGDLIVRLSVR
jgi:hypothetical protein